MTTHPETGERGFFLFAYGSICANPPPGQTERHNSEITGFRRDFAVQDIFYRGSKAAPGLTLGLDASDDGRVPGAVYFAPAATAHTMLAEVIAQETPKGMEDIYQRRIVEAVIDGGHKVPALAFVANPDSALYVGQSMTMAEKAETIAHAFGTPNNDYAKRHRESGLIGKTDLEYLAMTALRLEDDNNGDAYLSALTEMAVQKREAMLNSDDRAEVLKAQQLARFEVGTRVEKAFRDRIGVEVASAAAARVDLPGSGPTAQKLASGPEAANDPAYDGKAENDNRFGDDPSALISDSKGRLGAWKNRHGEKQMPNIPHFGPPAPNGPPPSEARPGL
ncbi:MAG: gamma-glutamylcyclotransferase [Pseudomonadota bacterium]